MGKQDEEDLLRAIDEGDGTLGPGATMYTRIGAERYEQENQRKIEERLKQFRAAQENYLARVKAKAKKSGRGVLKYIFDQSTDAYKKKLVEQFNLKSEPKDKKNGRDTLKNIFDQYTGPYKKKLIEQFKKKSESGGKK